jgi:hypothetical protein
VARHAWWELSGLGLTLWRGSGRERSAALRIAGHLLIGAAVMLGRMLKRPR